MQTFHDKTGCTMMYSFSKEHHKAVCRAGMDHVYCWNCISPNFRKLSSHRTCGGPRFRKGWFVKYSPTLSKGFQKVVAAGHRSRCRQTRADNRNCFLKIASLHGLLGYKRSITKCCIQFFIHSLHCCFPVSWIHRPPYNCLEHLPLGKVRCNWD